MALSLALAFLFALGDPFAAAGLSRGTTRTAAGGARTVETARPAGTAPSVKSAPSGPPLASPLEGDGAEGTAGVPSLEGDQLVENGLSSPLCEAGKVSALSSVARSNCQTSGFIASPVPTNNYDLDVNIDTGALGLSDGQLLSVVQDVLIAPVWEGLVWLIHALVVMLQWCYTLELLGGSMTSGLRSSLREAQASFTQPWLALAMAAASVLAFYNGLIRRRIGETLGQALLTIAMMAAGLWLIVDPLGTVGAVGQFANQASLGTLAAVAQGSTANASRTLGDSMRVLFASAIEAPWCYLEFGDVRWCNDPAMLEPRLRKAASSIVASEQAKLGCRTSLSCPASLKSTTLERTSELVGKADTNGALFLAFPANGPERNSSKDSSSLLHLLCQGESDSKCEGATATQAEFRSDGGTYPRMLGVALIAVGVLGMATLLGLIVIHLLASALISLFMLLLAPVVVLAPALGDTGRAVFSGWLTRLLGAVCSKLIFSFLLGVLMSMQRMLMSLEPLGWWTQWLLTSAFWWLVFLKRHQALAFVRGGGHAPAAPVRQTLGHRIRGARQATQDIVRPMRWAKDKLLAPLPKDEKLKKPQPQHSGPGRRGPEQTDTGAQQPGGKNQPTTPPRRQPDRTEQPGQEQPADQSQKTSAVEPSSRDGDQTAHAAEAPTAVETQLATPREPRDRVSSEASGGADSSRQNRDRSEKPTKLERAARLATDDSDPEYDEATRPSGARRAPQPPPAPPSQQHQSERQTSPPQASSELSGSSVSRRARTATESAGAPPSTLARSTSNAGTPNSQDMRMRTSREIMEDAREVAAGRKRQLGIEPLAEGELEP